MCWVNITENNFKSIWTSDIIVNRETRVQLKSPKKESKNILNIEKINYIQYIGNLYEIVKNFHRRRHQRYTIEEWKSRQNKECIYETDYIMKTRDWLREKGTAIIDSRHTE